MKKTENGKQYSASAFAYVPDPSKPSTWKLRLIEEPGGKPTPHQVGAAIAAFGKGFRGHKVKVTNRAKVKAKIRAAWRRANSGSGKELPSILK